MNIPSCTMHKNPVVVRDLGYAVVMGHPHVLCIGNFDGVHRGHQYLLRYARTLANSSGLHLGVLSFEPHPRQFFAAADTAPFRLTSPQQKIRLLGGHGADFIVAQNFDAAFAGLAAEAFLDLLFHPQHRIRHLIVGADFCFGRQRKGNIDLLRCRAPGHDCQLHIHDLLEADGIISSSRIRSHLAVGDVTEAATLLGRPWCINGQVQEGRKLGRSLEFPTANIALGDYLCPAKGVYVVRTCIDDRILNGVANIGTRPTVDGDNLLLEAHLFNFSDDIYGRYLDIELLHFLRPEQKFTSIELLRQQICQDAADAQKWLAYSGYVPKEIT